MAEEHIIGLFVDSVVIDSDNLYICSADELLKNIAIHAGHCKLNDDERVEAYTNFVANLKLYNPDFAGRIRKALEIHDQA